jgi:16S rRNA processing protein RimM
MTNDSATSWIVLAHLLRPQGRKGELLAELLTDFPERFDEKKRVFLASPNFSGEEAQARAVEVISFWLPGGKNEGRIVLQFEGIDSITAAEGIAGLDVIVPQAERLPLDDESEYISDLIGCTVYDRSTAVGVIDDVQFPSTPDGGRRLAEAAPLLAVSSPDGAEILIPFAKAFLVGIDVKERRVDMKLPEGLIEVNRASTNSDQKR